MTASVETLEDRLLLAGAGPQLISIFPNAGITQPEDTGGRLQPNEVLETAPRELVFRFNPGQTIDPASLAAIEISRSGFDNDFANGDVPVALGAVIVGEQPNEVIVRFADTLPDDQYRIRIRGTGPNPLRNTDQDLFNMGVDQDFFFEVDVGGYIEAVVHEPIVRAQELTVTDTSALTDGVTFTVRAGGKPITFEFDEDGVSNADNDNVFAVDLSLVQAGNTSDYALAIFGALNDAASVHGTAFGLDAVRNGSTVTISATDDTAFSPDISQPVDLIGLPVPGITISDGAIEQRENVVNVYFNANDPLNAVGENTLVVPRPADDGTFVIEDGDTFTIDDGVNAPVTFTMDAGQAGRFGVNVNAGIVIRDGDFIELDGQRYEFETGPLLQVSATDISGMMIGGKFTLTDSDAMSLIFEFTDGEDPAAGNIGIDLAGVANRNEIANRIAAAINNQAAAGFLITATSLANGTGRISLDGVTNDADVDVPTQMGFDRTGNLGVSSGSTAVVVKETFTSAELAKALSDAVNGTANRGYSGDLVNFPTVQAVTNASFTSPSLFTNLNLTSNPAGATTIDYYVGQTSLELATEIAGAVDALTSGTVIRRTGLVRQDSVVQIDRGLFTAPEDSPFTVHGDANPTTVESPAFYQLIRTNGELRLPDAVIYNADAGVATLKFNSPFADGTYNIRIGESFEATNTLSTTVNLGTRFGNVSTTLNDFIGGNPTSTSLDASDVDFYRFDVKTPGSLTLNLAATNGLNALVRVFNETTGTVIGTFTATPISGTTSLNIALPNAGAYVIGVSSVNNDAYSFTDGSGTVAGDSTGSYRLTITPDVAGASTSDDNSSFDTSTDLGNLGTAGQVVSSQIQPQSAGFNLLLPPEPGGNDEPGHKDIPIAGETHLNSGPDRGVDVNFPNGISTFAFTFDLTNPYGSDPQGNALFNAITPEQQQRTREIFELYSLVTGLQFVETESRAEASERGLTPFTIVTGDLRALDPTVPTGPGGVGGIAGGGRAIMDAGENFTAQDNLYGAAWFRIAMHEIGHLLGLGHALDIPAIMGTAIGNDTAFPGDHDITHIRRLFRRDSNDVDMYRFEVTETGVVTIETIAERLSVPDPASQLNTVLQLYRLEADGSRTLIAQNDDYYGNDSFISLELEEGTYFVGVSSVGNEDYDPSVSNSGSTGLTDGRYELRIDLRPSLEPIPDDLGTIDPSDVSANGRSAIRDVDDSVQFDGESREATAIDGDFDGRAGGVHEYSFQVGETIFVDKAAANYAVSTDPLGSITNPFVEIDQALNRARIVRNMKQSANPPDPTPVIVRILGNSGADGQLGSLLDNTAYEIGINNDPVFPQNLVDGPTLEVPRDINVVIDSGAVFKLQLANIDAGSSAQGIDRSRGSLQILGTSFHNVTFTSWHDDLIGGDSDGVHPGARPGDWGGIVFREDSDYDFEYTDTQTQRNIFAVNNNGTVNANNPFLYTFDGFPLPATGATLSFLGFGDFSDSRENLTVEFLDEANNVVVEVTIFNDMDDPSGRETDAPFGSDTQTISAAIRLSADDLAALTTAGRLRFRVRASNGGSDENTVNDINVIESLRVDLSIATAVPIFLNTVNHATIQYAGGRVVVDSLEQDFDAVHLSTARPTVTFNTITLTANAAISGNPNSFNDTFEDARRYDHHLDRLGPDIHGNDIFSNGLNGVRIRTLLENGVPIEKLEVPARLTSTDVVYVITENLHIDGSPGGLIVDPGDDPDIFSDDIIVDRTPGRLRIDPGVVVKLSGARIEMERGGSNLIAEGTPEDPIIFTSLNDDTYGRGASFDTNNDSQPVEPFMTPFFPQTTVVPPASNALGRAIAYLQANAESFGLTLDDLNNFIVTDNYATAHNGVTHIYLRQTLNDLEIPRADISIHVLPNGEILTASSDFLPGLTDLEGQPIDPQLTAEEALALLLENLELPVPDEIEVLNERGQTDQETVISGEGISRQDIPARLEYAPVDGSVELAWNFIIYTLDGEHAYDASVNADTGEILLLDDWVAHATYNVFALPNENPQDGPRTLEVDPHLEAPSASFFGWHDTDGQAGAEFTTTQGNNVSAYADRDDDDLPDAGSAPDGGTGLVFDNPLDTTQAPLTYRDAAVTNLFYWNNILHDVHHRYGFDEISGNFQVNNYGNGGLGGDAVEAQAQDGADIGNRNNANMLTPPDGISPRMQMFLFDLTTPERDGDLDAGIIVHEYGHGVTNRLTGGPSNAGALQALQSLAMGEGWSDWHTLMFHQVASDQANDARGLGTYVLNQGPNGPGIRTQPYSYDMTVNDLTYGDVLQQAIIGFPHPVGEIWATTLWDLNWALIEGSSLDSRIPTFGLGFDSDLYDGSGGNNLAMRLVMDGLKLQPANPSMLDARDAILAADRALTGGAFQQTIWTVFARRGMGFSADDGGSADSLFVTEAFDVPPSALSGTQPAPADWAGLVFNAASSGNFDYVEVQYGGGTAPIAGGFAGFNTVEIIQADVRIANSEFEDNADGIDSGTTSNNRIGRGANVDATIFVRGAQPIIVNNIFEDNESNVISINANAMQAVVNDDAGRATGEIYSRPFFASDNPNLTTEYANNFGPLVRNNRLENNDFNGMEIRGATLTAETVWDDVDIVHILRNEIVVPNLHTFGGLRLLSSSRESLVVKLDGPNAGFTAGGEEKEIDDRVGGTVEIVGTPGRPVVLTSLYDDTVGAGFTPFGVPLLETATGSSRTPAPGDWRSIRLDEFSNDRNVAFYDERERPTRLDNDVNNIPNVQPNGAEFLGELAPSQAAADDNRRAGYEVHGFINTDDPTDQDVYSFRAEAGTEVWFDVDRTAGSLDTVIELLNASGDFVFARSDNSQNEQFNPALIDRGLINPLNGLPDPNGLLVEAGPLTKDERDGGDFYTTNPKDAGMRVVLPGALGTTNTYFIRVRSKGDSIDAAAPDEPGTADGLTSGEYQLQIRLRQRDEHPGSTVTFSQLRYATNGIEIFGQPSHSALVGEGGENDATGANNNIAGADFLGNLLSSDLNTFGVAGNISAAGDLDFYEFDVTYQGIQQIAGVNSPADVALGWSTIFDIDYADGIARANSALYIFNEAGQLILAGTDSNIAEDQPRPLNGNDLNDPSRGTVGKLDPFIGSIELPEGKYYAVVSANARLPEVLQQYTNSNVGANIALTRLEPVDSVNRIAEDHIGSQGGMTFQPAGSLTPLIDLNTSVVPWHLGDVSLFVSQGTGNNSTFFTVDPFTGAQETRLVNNITNVRDIAIRRQVNRVGGNDFSGDLVAFQYSNNGNDNSNFLTIDSGNGNVISSVGDAIQTATLDNNGNPVFADNQGLNFNALTYSDGPNSSGGLHGAGQTQIYAVGTNFGDFADPFGATRNVLYRLTLNGTGTSTTAGNRNAQNAFASVAKTDIVERGVLDTGATGGVLIVPDAFNTMMDDFFIVDGDMFAVDDNGVIVAFEMDAGPSVRFDVDPLNPTAGLATFIRDGDMVTLDIDNDPLTMNATTFEFNTGAVIVVDAINGSDLVDGDFFSVQGVNGTRTFEFDNDGNFDPTRTQIDFSAIGNNNPDGIISLVVNSINNATGITGATASRLGATNRISLTGDQGINLTNVTVGTLSQEGNYNSGPLVIDVEEFFTSDQLAMASAGVINLTAGGRGFLGDLANFPAFSNIENITTVSAAVILDQGTTGGVTAGNVEVDYFIDNTANEIAQTVATAISNQGVSLMANAVLDRVTLTTPGDAFDLPGTDINPPFQIAGSAPGGTITGISILDGTMYAITDAGGLFRVNNPTSAGGASLTYITTATDLVGLNFQGLSTGPQTVENGIYSNMLFGITGSGELYAFNTSGVLQPIFVDGATSVSTGLSGATGLEFSNVDRNLWSLTDDRENDAGHGINPLFNDPVHGVDFDRSDIPSNTNNLSFYFGNDFANNPYFNGNTANNSVGGLAGGAHGSLETNSFSLQGYSGDDLPTLYFNYFLDSQDQNVLLNQTPTMLDSMRVHIWDSAAGQWDLLTTNNSSRDPDRNPFLLSDEYDYQLPPGTAEDRYIQEAFNTSGQWRQVRVNLSPYAGQSDLKLRFDFSSDGSMDLGNIQSTGIELRAKDASRLQDGQRFTIGGRTFEFDTGFTVNMASGSMLTNGDTVTVTPPGGGANVVFTFGGNIAFSPTDTAATIAQRLTNAINTNGALTAAGLRAVRNGDRVTINRIGQQGPFNVQVSSVTATPFPNPTGLHLDEFDGSNPSDVAVVVPLIFDAQLGQFRFRNSTEVATIMRQRIEDTFDPIVEPNDFNVVKQYRDVVRVIGHDVSQDFNRIRPGGELEIARGLQGDQFGRLFQGAGLNPNTATSRSLASYDFEGLYIDDIIIGFAERGEIATGAPSGTSNFVNNPSSLPEDIDVGDYQLEIRRGAEYQLVQAPFGPHSGSTIGVTDTNDRLADQLTVTIPDGNQIFDGQTFQLSDGKNTATFEFADLDLEIGDPNFGVQQGTPEVPNFAVGFRATESGAVIAARLRNLLNSTAVRNHLEIQSATADGDTAGDPLLISGNPGRSREVNLFGNISANIRGDVTNAEFNVTGFLNFERFANLNIEKPRIGDRNLERLQGSVQIAQNFIFDTAGVGILVDDDRRRAGDNPLVGAPRRLPTENDENLTRGVKLVNNVIGFFGDAGIVLNGDNNGGAGPLAAVPFHRVINNTIYGGDTPTGDGVRVSNNVDPTLLNNIIANTNVSINNATGGNNIVVARSAYQNNNSDPINGVDAQVLFAGESLFVDPSTRNFYLAEGARPIDSARNQFEDRDPIVQVSGSIGTPRSNLFAPNFDVFGQFRTNDEDTPNTGEGNPPFFDRGAIEREDVTGPSARLISPEDNDGGGRDLDSRATFLRILNTTPTRQFIIGLDDVGIGIDDTSVNTTNVQLRFNGSLLTAGVDYLFRYNTNTKQISLDAASGVFAEGSYNINLVNQNGLRDLAGNNVIPNRQPQGTTAFDIVIAPPPEILVNPASVLEGDSGETFMEFTVSLSGTTNMPISVVASLSESLAANAATAGDDYDPQLLDENNLPLANPLVFAAGELTKTIRVKVFGDLEVEGDEIFLFNLSDPVGANIAAGSSQVTGTITDDELFVRLVPNTQTQLEGDMGTTPMTFTVELYETDPLTMMPVLSTSPRSFDVSVDFSTTDGTALAGQDYLEGLGTVTFASGENTQDIDIAIIGDEIQEDPPLENFFVNLINPVSARIDTAFAQAEGVIQDDDPKFRVQDGDDPDDGIVEVVEGEDGDNRQIVFTVSISAPAISPVTVDYATQDGAATADDDYVPVSGTLTFDPINDPNDDGDNNPLTQQVTVDIIGDQLAEGDHEFFLVLSNASAGGFARKEGTGLIIEDEPRLVIDDISVEEGNPPSTPGATFTVTLTDGNGNPVVAPNDVTVDFTTGVGPNVTQPPGQLFEIEPNDDLASAQTLNPSDFVLDMNTDITDPDTIQHVTFAGRGDGTFDFYNFTGMAGSRLILDIDGATFDSQLFVFDSTGAVVFSNDDGFPNGGPNQDGKDAGSDSTEDAFLDVLLPATDTYTIAVGRSDSSPTSTGLAAGPAGTIESGDQYTLHISVEQFVAAQGGVVAEIEPNNSLATAQDLDDAGFTRVQNDNIDDISGVDTSTLIPHISVAGSGNGTFDYYSFTAGADQRLILDMDDTNFDTELFLFNQATGAVLAFNDDAGLDEGSTTSLDSFIEFTTSQAGTYVVGVGRFNSTASSGGISGNAPLFGHTYTLHISVEGHQVGGQTSSGGGPAVPDGSAVPNSDFTPVSGTLTILAGSSTGTITVPVNSNTTSEFDENFFVRLSNAVGAVIEDGTGEAVILDDDAPTINIIDPPPTPETGPLGSANIMTFTVRLSRPADLATTIDFSTADGSATGNSDYVPTSGTLTFAVGQQERTINVQLIKDGEPNEGDETFFVNLSNPQGADFGDMQGEGTIVDNTGLVERVLSVVAPDAGRLGEVIVLDALGGERFRVTPYAGFTGGIRIATGDVNNDGTPDVVTGPGPGVNPTTGMAPPVKVFSGVDGSEILSFFPYNPFFMGGVYVATGDFSEGLFNQQGDSFDDIIVGPDSGGGPHVRVFSTATGAPNNRVFTPAGIESRLHFDFMAYNPLFLGGVRVGGGDVTGDGTDDLVVAAGVGGGPHVQIFSGRSGGPTRTNPVPVQSFMAYDPRFTSGIYVAVGNVNNAAGNDGEEIITGTGPGGGPHVRVFNARTSPRVVSDFFPYDPNFRGGVRVGVGFANSADTNLDIITAPGPGGGPHLRAFSGGNVSEVLANVSPVYEANFVGGMWVSGVRDTNVQLVGQALQAAESNASSNDAPALTQADLDAAVDAAIDRLRSAGVSEADLYDLSQVSVTVGDLSGNLLGLATAGGVLLDVDAAGNGWFIDSTPDRDEEFQDVPGSRNLSAIESAAIGRTDLLTVVLHELGHKLGLDDLPSHLHPDALMSATLPVGTRRLPSTEEFDEAFTDESLFDSLLLD